MAPIPGRIWRRSALILALALAGSGGFAAEEASPWTVRVWKSADGLPGNLVNGITQTSDGYIWLNAGGKLTRFDGATFKTFFPADFGANSTQIVRAILCRRDGSLCLSVDRGTIISLKAGRSEVLASNLSASNGDLLFEDATGALWVGYRDGSVFTLSQGRITQLPTRKRKIDEPRIYFASDGQGKLWAVRDGQVGVYRDGAFSTLLRLPDVTVLLAGSRAGGVWICVGTRLYRYDEGGDLQQEAVLPTANPNEIPESILEDAKGGVWIGTAASGLWHYSNGKIEGVPTSDREISSLMEDHEGNLWATTLAGGVDLVQPRAVRIEGSEIDLPSATILAVAQAPDGAIWGVAQDGSLVRRTAGGWSHVLDGDRGIGGEATCLTIDASGAIWIGTKFSRLYRWSDGKLTSWGRDDGLVCHTVRTVLVRKSGDLWICGGGPGAVERLRGGKLVNFPLPAGPNYIGALEEGPNGDLWAGGANSKLYRISDDGHVSDETSPLAPRGKKICALRTLSDGSLLIGYVRGGVGRLKGRAYRQITADDGLSENTIVMIMPDSEGWLWLAGGESIFKVSERELIAFADRRTNRIQSLQSSGDRDLRNLRPSFAEFPSGALRTRDGHIWIPTATALVVVSPEVQRAIAGPPPVLITRVATDKTTIAAYGDPLPVAGIENLRTGAKLRIQPGYHRIEFGFTALSYGAPENVRFLYRLENFDDRWIDSGTDRTASYSQLTPGDYRFHVRASNSSGLWNETGAVIDLTVAPFLWQRWWFRTCALGVFTSLVFATARFVSFRRLRQRVRQLEQQSLVDKERARIARDIHDDLGSRLTKIVLLSNLVARDRSAPGKAASRVVEISDTARQLIKSLDETIWTVNPNNDTLPHLIDYVGQHTVSFLRTAEVICQVELPTNPPERAVRADVRHHVVLAVKEALTNVVRHACATAVWLRISLSPADLHIEIEDNGQGFDPSQREEEGADGLRNMRQRLKQIGGQCRFESKPGGGTKVIMIVRWPTGD